MMKQLGAWHVQPVAQSVLQLVPATSALTLTILIQQLVNANKPARKAPMQILPQECVWYVNLLAQPALETTTLAQNVRMLDSLSITSLDRHV